MRGWWAGTLLSALLYAGPRVEVKGIPSQLAGESSAILQPLEELNTEDFALLRARTDATVERLKRWLQGAGYLEVRASSEWIGNRVQIHVDVGPQYLVALVYWDLRGEDPTNREKALALLSQKHLAQWEQRPLNTTQMQALQEEGVRLLRRHGFAFARAEKVSIQADQQHQQVSVTLPIELGPQVTWGATEVLGLDHVKPELILQRLCWCEGQLYSLVDVESSRDNLLRLGLFNSVQIRAESRQENGPVLMSVEVSERKPRTLSLGLSYATTEGFGAIGEWEHRNLWGMGERLSVDAILAQRIQEFTLTGRAPVGKRPDLHAVGYAVLRRKHVKSFLEKSADLVGLVEWEFMKNGILSGGAKLEGLKTQQSPENGQDLLGSLPLFFSWTNAGDRMDPRQGLRFEAKVIPTGALGFPSSLFLPMRFAASAYVPVGTMTLAGRATFGSIVGAGLEEIPLPKRFFEGSADGLRGYAYQTVSPLNTRGTPIGGRSLLLYNLEVRAPLTKTIELVPFVDLGNVFASTLPRLETHPRTSVGLGLRYKTLLGPLRLDVAVPLNRRPELDKPFSIYFSMGQSF